MVELNTVGGRLAYPTDGYSHANCCIFAQPGLVTPQCGQLVAAVVNTREYFSTGTSEEKFKSLQEFDTRISDPFEGFEEAEEYHDGDDSELAFLYNE